MLGTGFITRFMQMFATNAYSSISLHDTKPARNSVKDKRGWAEYKNKLDASIELAVATQIFAARYNWTGEIIELFPHSFVERALAYTGIVCFIKEDGAIKIYPSQVKEFNDMWIPREFILLGKEGDRNFSVENCVPIYDNPLYISPFTLLERYSGIVADMGRTVEVYTDGMKTPTIVETDNKKSFSAQAAVEQKLLNVPYLILNRLKDKKIQQEASVFFNTSHNAADLQGLIMARKTVFAEMCSKVGVPSSHLQKSQYKSSDEISDETTVSNILLEQGLQMRKQGTRELKEMFDIDMECDISEKLKEKVEEYDKILDEEPQMQEGDKS